MPLSKEEKGKEEGGQREQASGGCRPPTDERKGGGGNFTLQTPSSFFSFPLPPVGVASPPLSPVSGREGERGGGHSSPFFNLASFGSRAKRGGGGKNKVSPGERKGKGRIRRPLSLSPSLQRAASRGAKYSFKNSCFFRL